MKTSQFFIKTHHFLRCENGLSLCSWNKHSPVWNPGLYLCKRVWGMENWGYCRSGLRLAGLWGEVWQPRIPRRGCGCLLCTPARAGSWPRQGAPVSLSQSKGHVHRHQVTVGETGINAAPWRLLSSLKNGSLETSRFSSALWLLLAFGSSILQNHWSCKQHAYKVHVLSETVWMMLRAWSKVKNLQIQQQFEST